MSSNEQCGSYSMPALEALFIETQPEDSWYPKHHTTKKQWSSLEALQLCTWTKVKRKQLRLSFSPKPNLRLLWEDSLLNHLLEWGHYKLSRRIHDTVSISRTQCKIYKLNIYIVHVSVHIYIYTYLHLEMLCLWSTLAMHILHVQYILFYDLSCFIQIKSKCSALLNQSWNACSRFSSLTTN